MRFLILAVLLVATCPRAAASEALPGPYLAQLVRVIDGDTIEVRVHVWLGLDQTVRVRLVGVDAPEMHGACPAAAIAARDFLARLLDGGPLVLTRITHDKYGGRVDAAIGLPTGEDAAQALLAAGLVGKWPSRKGAPNCPPFGN
ncbi:putative Staphylococcal nuclease-like protein [Magnetospirillum sp. LM-5]|uniref:thermonuclease family protein n=1 Tax=Magnetospirillum sp. LM-5 TaxID=2681466 RepID=UPI001383059D|nr:thermonuclease family protein [Magnetospirillum sp. LM-5]CAA7612543.1 putative Staphylococcal nuclease-like protein [Magnetospirillum sp. LM-5]